MTPQKLKKYRAQLEKLARDTGAVSQSLEDAARTSTGGESSGSLSNAPMHLGDLGTEVYTQELNATLLENEDAIRQEVQDALGRLQNETFGICEDCRKKITQKRLDAVPYARFCVKCAEKEEAASGSANMNHGRLTGWGSSFDHPSALSNQKRSGEQSPTTARRANSSTPTDDDSHAAGTPGGGTAVGGIAGMNNGDGEPDDTLEDAMGSGNFDAAIDPEEARGMEAAAYAGLSGGAVGGTPANKRASGGKTHGGLNPHSDSHNGSKV